MKKIKKTAIITSAFFTLAFSPSFGGERDQHRLHHGEHHHDSGTKSSLLNRLAMAPAHCCSSHLRSVEHAALSASSVFMIGKVEYDLGESCLGPRAEVELSEMLLHSGLPLGPDTLLVVLGYADRTGRADRNYRLSGTRAELVRNRLEQLISELRLGVRTASIAMGEEAELCEHHLGHNRVAEIWWMNLTRPADQFTRQEVPAYAPVLSERALAPWVAPGGGMPAPARVVAPADSHDHHNCQGHHHSNEAPAGNEAAQLLQGMGYRLATVENRVINGQEVTALPLTAIISENGKTTVAARSDADPSKFERWEVTLGRSDGSYIEAVTGVFPGDTIITNPLVRQ